MALSNFINTFGQYMLSRHGQRVHKIAIDAGFTCPNRDGSIGRGGCTFCNNSSFSPNGRQLNSISQQIASGRSVIKRRTGATRFVAYFQAYTNTYDDIESLKLKYQQALTEPDVIGLAVGTRPDCVPDTVLDLLTQFQDQGFEIWLELGLQSSFDKTLRIVNRGHGYAEYQQTVRAAQSRNLKICTHLIVGLPTETAKNVTTSLSRVLDLGVNGLKFHPLHVVKGTALANTWRRGEYITWAMEDYIELATNLIELTPRDIIFHRITATASKNLLLAPSWCQYKWRVLNGIEAKFRSRDSTQGMAA